MFKRTQKDAGLKIRPRRLHQNAASRKALRLFASAFSLPARRCTKMQQSEQDPAPDPALADLVPDFAALVRKLEGGALIRDS